MKKRHVRLEESDPLRQGPAEEAVARILRAVFAGRPGPVTVAIGGPGGTGKTAFARNLAHRLGDAAVLALDDYKEPRAYRRQAGIFGPHPRANKMELIADHLARVRRVEAFDKPVYDSSIGDAGRSETYRPARFNLAEGEVSTYPRFRGLVDFAVFIDADLRTQLATRLGRDIEQRNYTREKALATFLHSNLQEFPAFGAEGKAWADACLFCRPDYRLEIEAVCCAARGLAAKAAVGRA